MLAQKHIFHGRDELICKAEIESQMWRTNFRLTRQERSGINWEIGTATYTPLWITR